MLVWAAALDLHTPTPAGLDAKEAHRDWISGVKPPAFDGGDGAKIPLLANSSLFTAIGIEKRRLLLGDLSVTRGIVASGFTHQLSHRSVK